MTEEMTNDQWRMANESRRLTGARGSSSLVIGRSPLAIFFPCP
jgi:hypothetical protein